MTVVSVTRKGTPRDPRDDLVVGVDQPTLSNTGVRNKAGLTVVTSLVPDGSTYRNLEVRAVVNFNNAPPSRFENCWFRGPTGTPSTNGAMLKMWDSGNQRGHVFVDCTIEPQAPHFRWNGILGYGFTARRCQFLSNTDHVGLYNNNGTDSTKSGPLDVTIEQCYFGGNGWWPQSIDTGGGAIGSHCDQVQYQGGSNVVVRGNTFTGKIGQQFGPNSYGDYNTNSVLMLKPDVGQITGLVWEKNWIDGGRVSINIANDPPDRTLGNIGAIRDNRFGRTQGQPSSDPDRTFTILMPSNVSGVFTGNVYDDDGGPVYVRTNG